MFMQTLYRLSSGSPMKKLLFIARQRPLFDLNIWNSKLHSSCPRMGLSCG